MLLSTLSGCLAWTAVVRCVDQSDCEKQGRVRSIASIQSSRLFFRNCSLLHGQEHGWIKVRMAAKTQAQSCHGWKGMRRLSCIPPRIFIFFLRYARTLGPSSSLDPVIFLVETFKLYEILPFKIKLATAVLETPTRSKFHSNWKTLNTDLVPSRLCKILWQDMLWDIGTGSHCKINVPNLWGTVITHHTKKLLTLYVLNFSERT